MWPTKRNDTKTFKSTYVRKILLNNLYRVTHIVLHKILFSELHNTDSIFVMFYVKSFFFDLNKKYKYSRYTSHLEITVVLVLCDIFF